MDRTRCKRQKQEYDSSQGTQSEANIISHNAGVRLQLLEQYNDLKHGSATEDVKAMNMKRREIIRTVEKLQLVPIRMPYASPALKSSDARLHSPEQKENNFSCDNVIDLDPDDVVDHTHTNLDNIGPHTTVFLDDSDDEDRFTSFGGENSSAPKQSTTNIQECLFPEQPSQHQDIIMLDNKNSSYEAQFAVKEGTDVMGIDNILENESHCLAFQQSRHDEKDKWKEGEIFQRKGTIEEDNISVVDFDKVSCKVIQGELPKDFLYENGNGSPFDELEDLWRDMTFALACSKTNGSNNIVPLDKETREEVDDDCHHDFLMKDDLGIVCRVCGLIQQRIENIFEHQWKKRKQSYRKYPSEHKNSSDLNATANPLGAVLEVVPGALAIHPLHSQQMKPHQVEGFNFLIKNLADENNPGGCILAHAPGSGKTFMLISFINSFLARYPAGRPLIILPKGILATWREEFRRWQIEDIPLYDFYSAKADNRSEQLKLLNLWEDNRSILLLGYQQFACIVSDHTSDTEALMCKEKLLTVPSLVILDEGHTPRNEETDLLTSLANIKTPRKVVLSGTLFQNHVSEVFNILNLVRPKFLKMERSRAIKKRILSMVGKRSDNSEKYFYSLVEENLQKEASDKTRVMMIQNLRELTANVLHYYQGENLEELPGLADFTIFLNLSTKQEEIIKNLVGNKFGKRSKCNAVSLHPCLTDVKNFCEKNGNIVDKKIGSIICGIDMNDGVKVKFILNLLSLSEAAGEKVLVFSQYVRSLLFLERLVIRTKGWKPDVHTFKIHGGSSNDQREQAVHRFNNSPDAKVFFGSIKACGEGISLVGASRIVILDVHENPSVMRQAIGRAFRPGQTKMVYCYRLVAFDSPEEDDHHTAFRKERVSKLWFEWNEFSGNADFELASVDVSESEDRFLESPALQQDIKSLYKR